MMVGRTARSSVLPARRVATACALALGATLATTATAGAQSPKSPQPPHSSRHTARRGAPFSELLSLSTDWRAFQQPVRSNGVPDYSTRAMAVQRAALPAFQRRLATLDTTGWTTAQQVDYHIVRAEMNGLDFDLRVRRPWATDPAFYVMFFPSRSDQPAREGPVAAGAIELWTWSFPLTADRAAALAAQLRIIPGSLRQARQNLTGNGRDLWTYGTRSIAQQSVDLAELAARVAGVSPALDSAVREARVATDQFHAWLELQTPHKTGPSGLGVANYDWYLRNVQLVPYTWADEELLMRRELARSRAALALEEDRDRALPASRPIATESEYARRFNGAVTDYMAFLRGHDVLAIRDYMDPALRARQGTFAPPDRPREFFDEVSYRDPIVMLTHDYHWFDLARMAAEPNPDPIRRGPLLYNVFVTRTEGFATAMEEMMLHEGFLDGRPRSAELIYVLVAERAARALGDLHLQNDDFTMQQAAAFASGWTPRGWLRVNGNTVWGEQHLYLEQPAYGTSYLVGKMEFEQLMADRAHQLGDAYSTRRFMDEFNAAGLIPMSLIRWQMTGNADEIVAMTRGTSPHTR